ncbi:MAG: right-handed parallel beta-helix repeat-containing protein, partial [Minisyncoccia bacterium]
SALNFDFTLGNTADTNVAGNGTDLLTSVTNGSYTITGSPTPTSTPTPTPTPTGRGGKFNIGEKVRATANINVRANANISGTLYGFEPMGAIGTILNGPITQGGFDWWNINYEVSGGTGWSADTYLVSNGSNPTPTPTATPTPSNKFTIGQRIQTSATLNVRSQASLTATVIGTQPYGAAGTITGGPVNQGTFNWWNVNYDTGVDGWSVEDFMYVSYIPTPTPTSPPPPTPTPTGTPTPTPTNPPGKLLYVSPNGSDSSSCTQTAPCREIRKALSLVSSGTTILVADGTYKGFDVSDINGTGSDPIEIKAQGSNAVVTATSDRSDNRDNIYITYSSYIVIDGLKTYSAPRSGIRVDSSPFVTIRNNVTGNNNMWGIFTNHSNDLLIENNETYGSVVQHGIYVSNSADRPVIRGNVVHDNTQGGIQLNGDLSAGGSSGVPGDGIISGAVIENNIIYNNGRGGGGGINLPGVQDSVIRNNLLYNNHATGITAYIGEGASGPKGIQFLNNTIDMASDARWALQIQDATGTNTIRNNIFYNRNSARGALDFLSPTDAGKTDSNYNIFAGAQYVTTDDWNTRITISEWKAQGKDQNSVTVDNPDAMFMNSSSGDYHLSNGSQAIDKGTTLSNVSTDRDGRTRPQGSAYDIGAYEK